MKRNLFSNYNVKKAITSVVICTAVTLGGIGCPSVFAEQSNGQINFIVNGESVVFADQSPVIVEDRTLIPLRGVFEKMGFQVDWDASIQRATLTNEVEGLVIEVLDSQEMSVNGKNYEFDVPARILNDRLMIPLRAVSEASGAEVKWDEASRTVSITTKKEVVPPVTDDIKNNTGAWDIEQGITIPGISKPLKVGMQKSDFDALFGPPVRSVGDLDYIYTTPNGQLQIYVDSNYKSVVQQIRSAIPGTTAFGIKVGDAYPDNYDLSKFPSHVRPQYIATGMPGTRPNLNIAFLNSTGPKLFIKPNGVGSQYYLSYLPKNSYDSNTTVNLITVGYAQ